MGRRYANGRNTDHGAGRHTAVSVLSPYIRRRLVLEADAVAAAVAAAEEEEESEEEEWREVAIDDDDEEEATES